MNVKDINAILETDEIVKVQETSNCLIFSTPSRRFGVFGCHLYDDTHGVEIIEIPYLYGAMKSLIEEKLPLVLLEPNDTKSQREFEKVLYEALMQRFPRDKVEWSSLGAYVQTKPEYIDRGQMTGYIVVMYNELRVVYAFVISPGKELFEYRLDVEELIDSYPEWAE